MGQILHGSATTTHAVRAAIQRSKATAKELAERHGLDPKTVAKWKKRDFVEDAPMGPKAPRSTVLTPEEEAIAVAFRKHTLLPLDDCLYALQATIPHLTRSSKTNLNEVENVVRDPGALVAVDAAEGQHQRPAAVAATGVADPVAGHGADRPPLHGAAHGHPRGAHDRAAGRDGGLEPRDRRLARLGLRAASRRRASAAASAAASTAIKPGRPVAAGPRGRRPPPAAAPRRRSPAAPPTRLPLRRSRHRRALAPALRLGRLADLERPRVDDRKRLAGVAHRQRPGGRVGFELRR